MQIIQLTECDEAIFPRICSWYYEWLGRKSGESLQEVECTMAHSLNRTTLPQTFVALVDGEPAGMYQLAVTDDLYCRPDLYPWLINVYVDERFRGRGIGRKLLETVKENARRAGMTELYLYTTHTGLYERFGWQFVSEIMTFKRASPIQRLYRLSLS